MIWACLKVERLVQLYIDRNGNFERETDDEPVDFRVYGIIILYY